MLCCRVIACNQVITVQSLPAHGSVMQHLTGGIAVPTTRLLSSVTFWDQQVFVRCLESKFSAASSQLLQVAVVTYCRGDPALSSSGSNDYNCPKPHLVTCLCTGMCQEVKQATQGASGKRGDRTDSIWQMLEHSRFSAFYFQSNCFLNSHALTAVEYL